MHSSANTTTGGPPRSSDELKSFLMVFVAAIDQLGVRTRNGNLSTVRSALLVDWSANPLSRNAQAPSQSSWSFQFPSYRKTSCNRILECFLFVE
jgi:hypothetical protein